MRHKISDLRFSASDARIQNLHARSHSWIFGLHGKLTALISRTALFRDIHSGTERSAEIGMQLGPLWLIRDYRMTNLREWWR